MVGLLAAIAWHLGQLAQFADAGLKGSWTNPRGTVVLLIDQCPGSLCGRVQWASDQAVSDARKRGTDPLVGAELLSEVVATGPDRWSARLFVPDLRRTSRVQLLLIGENRLKVTGCAVGRIVCKSQFWSRTAPR